MTVAVTIHATSPSTNPVFNVHPNSGDVWVEITQPNQIDGALVTIDWGDGRTTHLFADVLKPGTSFPAAVWKTATFSHNYSTPGTYTITAFGDGSTTGWYLDDIGVKQPLPTTTLTYTVVGGRRLRQYPRDDAIGGAPRQGTTNGPTSIQSSSRQGWINTYR